MSRGKNKNIIDNLLEGIAQPLPEDLGLCVPESAKKRKYTPEWDNQYELKFSINEEKEEDKMYELPYLPGKKVCLNPENREAMTINKQIKADTGYIVSPEDCVYGTWHKLNRKENVYVNVMFENGKVWTCKYKHLLPIETPYAKIESLNIGGWGVEYIINGKPRVNLDEVIIKHKCTIRNREVYDDKWRERIWNMIKENMQELPEMP